MIKKEVKSFVYSISEELPTHQHAFANNTTNYGYYGGVLNCGGVHGTDYPKGSGSGTYSIDQYITDVPNNEIYSGEHVIPFSLKTLLLIRY